MRFRSRDRAASSQSRSRTRSMSASASAPGFAALRKRCSGWSRSGTWPPTRETENRELYTGPNASLSFEPPASADGAAFDSYVSDPAHPIPYRKRPIELTYDERGSHWRPWLYEDQRFVDGRPVSSITVICCAPI